MELQIEYTPGICLFLALLCLTVPIRWTGAFLLAAAVHECAHILAVCLQGGRIHSVTIGASGAVIDTSVMTPAQELISLLAGPAGSLALVCLCRYFPRTAVCGLVHGIFNLLPVYPLDGGRALVCVIDMFFGRETGKTVCVGISRAVWVTAAGAAGFCCFYLKWGILPVAAAAVILIKCFRGKLSCKDRDMGVQ